MVEDLVEFIKELLLILSLPVSIDIMKDILERSLGTGTQTELTF